MVHGHRHFPCCDKMESTEEDKKYGPIVTEIKNDYVMQRLISATYDIYRSIGGFSSLSVENIFVAYDKKLNFQVDTTKFPLFLITFGAFAVIIFGATAAAVLLGSEFWFRKTGLFKSLKRDGKYFACRVALYFLLISATFPLMAGVHIVFLGQRYMARGFLDDNGLLNQLDLLYYRINESFRLESQSFVMNSVTRLYKDRSAAFTTDIKSLQKRYLTKLFAGKKFDAYRAADQINYKLFFYFDFYKEVVREIMRTMLMYSYAQRDLYNDGYATKSDIFRGFFYGMTKECWSRLSSWQKTAYKVDPMIYIPTCYQLFDIYPLKRNIFNFVSKASSTKGLFTYPQFFKYHIGNVRSHIPQLNYDDGLFLRYTTFLVNYGFGRNATISQYFEKVLTDGISYRYTQTKNGSAALENLNAKLMNLSDYMIKKSGACNQLLHTTIQRLNEFMDDIRNLFSMRRFLSQDRLAAVDLMLLLCFVMVLIIVYHCVLAIFFTKPRFHSEGKILSNLCKEWHEDKQRKMLAFSFAFDAVAIFVFILASGISICLCIYVGGVLHFGLCRHIPHDTKETFDKFKNVTADAASAPLLEKLTTLFYYCAVDHRTYGYDLELISHQYFADTLINLEDYLQLQTLADRIKIFDSYELPYEFYSNYIMIVFGCSTMLDIEGKELKPDNIFTDHLYNAYVDDWPPNREKYTIEDFIKFATPKGRDMPKKNYLLNFKGFSLLNYYLSLIKQLNFFFTMSNEGILKTLDRLQVRVLQLVQGLDLQIRKYKAFQKNFRNVERFRTYFLKAHEKGYCDIILNNKTMKLGDAIKDTPFLFNNLTDEELEIKKEFLDEFKELVIATFRRSVDVSCKPAGVGLEKALSIFCKGIIDPMNVMGLGFFVMFISLIGIYIAVFGLAPLVAKTSMLQKTDFQRFMSALLGIMTATNPMVEKLSKASKVAFYVRENLTNTYKSLGNTNNTSRKIHKLQNFIHPLLECEYRSKTFDRPGRIKSNKLAAQWLLDPEDLEDLIKE